MSVSPKNTTPRWDWQKYFEVSAAGALRGVAGLPIEHPFDCVKTKMQANPQIGAAGTVRQVFTASGWRGFYAGAIPNSVRAAIKQSYRWPMMVYLPPYLQEILPKRITKDSPTAVKTSAGLVIAHFETFAIAPLERLKVELMTAPKEKRQLTHFFEDKRGELRRTLYKGTTAVYARQMASWVSFLAADGYFKSIERKKYPDAQYLPFTALMKVAFEVGFVNTIANMPFDVAKTRIQQHNATGSVNIFKVMRRVFDESGTKGLYAGWQVRMTQYMVHSIFTVTMLEYFEQRLQS